MREILNNQDRISFDEFCGGWLYQALGWPEQKILEWFRDCIKAYRALEADQRYPLPDEKCYAIEAFSEGNWPEIPQRLVLRWFPANILHEFAERRSPMHELPYVYFDPQFTRTILMRLDSAGFELTCADTLIQMACGYIPNGFASEALRSLIESAE
jgi:hypothetical protein